MRRKEGALVPLEVSVLEAALDLRDRGMAEAHGFLLAKEMRDGTRARRLTAYGTLYKALDRLERAGYLASRWEDPLIAARDGRPRRRFYRVTLDGEGALAGATKGRREVALPPLNGDRAVMNGSPVAALVRGWVRLYTRGLPAPLRDARRDEIDDDLWCQHEEAAAIGCSARSLDADLVLRLLFGLPADLSWRLTYRGHATSGLERSSSMNTSVLGVLAIVAGLSFGILAILFVPFGEAVWTGSSGIFGVLGSLVGVIAFSAAALGLAWRFQDRVSPLAAVGALLVTVGALAGMVASVVIVALPVGSAMLMWDFARIGVVPRLLSTAHVAAAIVLAAGSVLVQLDPGDAGGRAIYAALFAPYLLTWVAIGVSLFRGAPQARATGA